MRYYRTWGCARCATNWSLVLKITFEPSGRSFETAPDEEILTAGIRAGLTLPYGCKDGACGSCKCKKLAGTVIHRAHQEKALSAAEEADGYVLTCCARAITDVVLESKLVGAEGALPIVKMPVRVASIEKVSPDVAILRLQLPAGNTFKYHPGQYIEVLLTGGLRRSYSMANAPGQGTGVELHLRHMPGGRFTDHVFLRMQEKEILRVEGPFGSFYLRDSDKPMVLLASGTGFAPIKALLEHMAAAGIQRPATLFWGGRRPQDLYMHQGLLELLKILPQVRYVPVVSEAQDEDQWTGETGWVHQAVMREIPDLSGHQVYACGVPVMVDAARRDFTSLSGLPSDEFYADSFTSEADKSH
jgi:CDP-4-dehydro-6-deoxyglucose reductase